MVLLLCGLLNAGADLTTRFVIVLESSTFGVVNVVRIIAGDASLDSISLSLSCVIALVTLCLYFFLGGVTVTTSEYTLFLLLRLFLEDKLRFASD